MTQLGTPHLHLLVNGLGKRRDRCREAGRHPPYSAKWIQKVCKEDCLLHEFGKAWFDRTGAFVVDVRRVYSPRGVAAYLGKYLIKGFLHRERLVSLGFVRRWSCSRNWPREERLQLAGTVSGLWEGIEIVPRYFRREEMLERVARDKKAAAVQRVGSDLGEKLRALARRRRGVMIIGGLLNESL